ncbi:methylated-DNA--[protein]-cysteine S-methyltransferase [Dinghuibacter silviterrae]|uniref:methylated-DNA--[protein]-cysteine S-methyltransferase n=1 Tax=Dinghuibacter silviterrae TaxID=1539049 RepID=A0A4R8DQ92_9BACT|nr:methylated-DNA--[protein]-cysteine S-methyltransferase [Dinghuibacter silviterrae]TDX00302.1 AraC family transcriptional regulator of adaptative response/methylated-DNA-[protein]-cysteine methyltransferase [Dinghuibacter silviterrae]
MDTQKDIDYQRIADAIEYYQAHFKEQPSLDAVAAQVHVSPYHFQRMFREWAGVTPKQFLGYISLEHAKTLLQEPGATLFDTAFDTGLSGTGRLHDLFIKVEGMTPGEYKNGGSGLTISYGFAESPFGPVIVASTGKGICHIAFADEGQEAALTELQSKFPRAAYRQFMDAHQQEALFIFTQDWRKLHEIKLHLKGTPFQLKVWETLLTIPLGGLTTYAGIADTLGQPKAARAVGSAVADNPVAFLIPCHRVIKSTGAFGQYHWGPGRKAAMIGWEAARVNGANDN